MLIQSDNQTSVFIHIPKVAGNTFQHALIESGYSIDQIFIKPGQDGINRFGVRSSYWRRNFTRGLKTLTKHQELSVYLNYCHANEHSTLRVLSFVRDPINRLISLYFSPHRSHIHTTNLDNSFNISEIKTFLQSVRTQRDFLQGLKDVNHKLVRVEDLNNKLHEVCNFLNIPTFQLKSRNQSLVGTEITADFKNKVIPLILNSKHAEDYAFLAENNINYEP